MGDFIVTWDSYFGEHNPQEREMVVRRRLEKKGIVLPRNLEIDTKGKKLRLYINDGRWLVNCPDCNAAHFAREDELFMCNNCGNASVGKMYRRAQFPRQRKSVEAILLLRLSPQQRHWTTETLDELKTENLTHGDSIVGGGA